MSFFKSYEDKIRDEEEKQRIYKEKLDLQLKKIEAKKELEDEKKYTNKAFSIMKKTKPRHKGWINSLKDYFKPTKTMLIHMELRNGFHTQFVVVIKNNRFRFDKGDYVIDDDLKYYDMAAKLWALNYHQDFPVPIINRVAVSELKRVVRSKGISNVDTAFNPTTLKQFIESEVIQKVMKGQEMEQVFKFLKLMLILNVVMSAITMIIVVKSSGILSNMQLPWM